MALSLPFGTFVPNEQPTILKEGYQVELWGFMGDRSFLNGKVGTVMAIDTIRSDSIMVSLEDNNDSAVLSDAAEVFRVFVMEPRDDDNNENENNDTKYDMDYVVVVTPEHVKIKVGNGYSEVTFIFQMPDNPDYTGEAIQSGEIQGGTLDKSPAFLIAFDPANWESFKNDVLCSMVAHSVCDDDNAREMMQKIEAAIPRAFENNSVVDRASQRAADGPTSPKYHY